MKKTEAEIKVRHFQSTFAWLMRRENSYFTVLTVHITIWRKRWANFHVWQIKRLRLSILRTALGTDINCSREVQTYHFWMRDTTCSFFPVLHSHPSRMWASTRMSPQHETGSGKLLQTLNLSGYSLLLAYINRLRRTAEIRKMIYSCSSTIQKHWSCGLMDVQEHIKANQRRFSSLPSQ